MSGMAGRYAQALFALARKPGRRKRPPPISPLSRNWSAPARICTFRQESGFLRRRAGQGARRRARQGRHRRARRPNFMKLVAANRRLFAVRDMIRDFRKLDARERASRGAEVTVAETLTRRMSRRCKNALTNHHRRQGGRSRRQGRSRDHRRADRQARLAAWSIARSAPNSMRSSTR